MGGCLHSETKRTDIKYRSSNQTTMCPNKQARTQNIDSAASTINDASGPVQPVRRSPSLTYSELRGNRPEGGPRRENLHTMDQISQTLTELERGRARDSPVEAQHQDEDQVIVLGRNELLFLLYQSILNQNMEQVENIALLIRLLDLLSTQQGAAGLNQEELANIQCVKTNHSDGSCAVCQQSLEIGIQVMRLTCKHEYHPDCIKPWLQKSQHCPMCRASARVQK